MFGIGREKTSTEKLAELKVALMERGWGTVEFLNDNALVVADEKNAKAVVFCDNDGYDIHLMFGAGGSCEGGEALEFANRINKALYKYNCTLIVSEGEGEADEMAISARVSETGVAGKTKTVERIEEQLKAIFYSFHEFI